MTLVRISLLSACAFLISANSLAKMTEQPLAKSSHEAIPDAAIYPKASSILKKMLLQYLDARSGGATAKSFSPDIPFTHVVDGKLLVEITTHGQAREVLESLKSLGLTHGAAFYKQISGFIPFDNIESLLEHQGVRFVRPSMSTTNAGVVTTQGDPAQKTDEARATFGVDGTGIKVATISDSIDAVTMPTGLADDQSTGDLPYNIVVIPPSVPVPPGFTDEGRAMMQIVHDIAPGATLFFRTGQLGEADFALGILELVQAKVHIINDDVLNFSEPWFQDGIVAQAAKNAVIEGIHFFSAAANQGEKSYQASFTRSAIPPPTAVMGPSLTGILHDFNTTAVDDPFQRFVLQDQEVLFILFQYAQPFVSACEGDCPGPTTNLDIALFDVDNMVYVAAGADDNVASGAALELMQYQNTSGGVQNLDLMIANVNNGPDPSVIKYIIPTGPVATEYDTKSSTLVAHANAEKVIAVAASAFFFTPEFGQSPPLVNNTSSLGGTPILFDTNNQELDAPVIRPNPDITGPDGGNNTFFGDDLVSPSDPDTFPNFFGTSAATPHVAGLAALILDFAPSPSAVSTDLMELVLENSAIDILKDSTGQNLTAGFDLKSGFGLVQADIAVCGDIDNDTVCINEDECPQDPNKTDTGACGCGRPESSCHGRGGGFLRSYPIIAGGGGGGGGIDFGDEIIIERTPLEPSVSVVQPTEEDVKPAIVKTTKPETKDNVSSADLSEDHHEPSSCSSLNSSAYDLLLLVWAIFYLARRRKTALTLKTRLH